MESKGNASRIVLITGGGGEIGSAIANKFAAEGYVVIITYHSDAEKASKVLESLSGEGHWAFHAPNTDAEKISALIDKIRQKHGKLHVLVNNAGITQDARLQKMTLEQFDRVIDVNLRGVFHCAQAVCDTMVAQGSGVILNASSVVGIYGNFGQTNYAASKFGVIGFTKTWSRELGPKGVRVNAVAPGFVSTPILSTIPDKVMQEMIDRVPLKRLGQPEDIANVYAFLASDEAAYINGAVIEVSGGMTV